MAIICKKCGDSFVINIKINGKYHNLCNRKYCLKCSPFKKHNTKKLEIKSEETEKFCNDIDITRNVIKSLFS